MSIANFLEDTLLNLVFNATSYSGQSTVYVKLHTGDPGEDCTSNAATETTRKAVTFGASSTGTISNDADITWTNVSTGETYSHISIWDNLTTGNPLWYGQLTANKTVNAGDTFTIATGDLDVSLN